MRNLLYNVRHFQASSILPTSLAAANYAAVKIVLQIIHIYQKTLSPDHGPLKYLYPYGYCRHSPTCSEYAKEQLQKRGLLIGSVLAIKRILSCNPFTRISDEKWREMAKRQISSL